MPIALPFPFIMQSLVTVGKAAIATAITAVGVVGLATITESIENVQETTKSRSETLTKPPRKPVEYWAVDINANKITPLTYTDALLRVETGGNIIAINQISAFKIATLYPVRRLEIDRGKEGVIGYYWHYHVSMDYNENNIHGEPHIWFEGPKMFDY